MTPFLLSAMAVAACMAALWFTRTLNPLRGDSAEYLYFDPSRPVGYPAFLALIRLITGHVALAIPAQIVLVAGSMLFLGLSFYRLSRSPVLAIGVQALLLAMPTVWAGSAHLMTEALSTALVALWCGLLFRMLIRPSFRSAVMLVLIAAAATTVRPSLVALFGATATVLWILKTQEWRTRASLAAVSGLLLAWAATPLAQFLVHGSLRTTSPLARGVLQHTLYCRPDTLLRSSDALFVEHNAAAVRGFIETIPSGMREQFRRAYSTPLRFGLIIPVLGRRHHLSVRSAVDPYLSTIAAERARANPTCFLTSVAREYLRMTMFVTGPTAEEAREIRTFIKIRRPPELQQVPVLEGDAQMIKSAAVEVHGEPSGFNPQRMRLEFDQKIPLLAVLPARILYALAALLGGLSLLAIVRPRVALRSWPLITATVGMGIAVHGVLAITAIVEFSDERYLEPIWPIVCAIDGLTLFVLVQSGAFARLTRRAGRLRDGHCCNCALVHDLPPEGRNQRS